MALEVNPIGGNPEKTKLDLDGEYPPVAEDEGMGEERQHEGSTSVLIAEGLTLQARTYGPDEHTLCERLPESTKKMLGMSGGGRTDHFV